MRTLYFFHTSATLSGSARRTGVGAVATADALARSVQDLLRPPGAAGLLAAVRRRAARRQCAQVDAGDAGARDRAGLLPSVPTLHHPRPLGCRAGLAPPAGGRARTARHRDPRRNQFSETGQTLGRRRAAVLRGTGEGGQLPGRRHDRALDRRARVVAGRDAVSAGRLGHGPRAPRARADSRPRGLPGEVAPRVDVAAAGPGGGPPADGRGRRRGIWRQQHVAAGLASLAAAVRAGHLGRCDPLSRYAGPAPAAARRSPAESPRGVARSGPGGGPAPWRSTCRRPRGGACSGAMGPTGPGRRTSPRCG